MRNLVTLVCICSFLLGQAQESTAIQKEIDSNVWKPFQEAFEALDAEKLNALYGDDVLRVTPSGIDTDNKFIAANLARFQEYKVQGVKIELDFWFDSRFSNEHTSYEVGFYSIRFVKAKSANVVYGQFHIVLKKIDGAWKITQDWDTTTIAGEAIGANVFGKQPPLQF